ncbi:MULTISPECIES: hypothetical protein [Nocardia]|uniref:hypothetical protein n=1 Tax=Nocardia TaxID=1817 RepID=UPI0024550163|nr:MULTISPECIES: hypothetical protein [Nocardia]
MSDHSKKSLTVLGLGDMGSALVRSWLAAGYTSPPAPPPKPANFPAGSPLAADVSWTAESWRCPP